MTLLSLLAVAHGATLQVGASRSYTTINAAISAAASGDTIEVDPGTYAEDIDLRGHNVTLTATSGPARTTIAPTTTIYLDGGTIEGFTISPAASVAIAVASGSPSLKELSIVSPATYGVQVTGGSPLIQEVIVWNAGLHGFIVKGGTAEVTRSISWGATNYGFDFKVASTVNNCLSVGGVWGFVFEVASSTATNLVAVGASTAAVGALYTSTITNSVFEDNTQAVRCFSGAVPSFPNGIAWNTATVTDCSSSMFTSVDEVDPLFTSWASGLSIEQLDFRPAAGSPMVNGGTGTDTDGSVADLGIFGGSKGGWSDRDGDGTPVFFDCDDHDATTYPGATERADSYDNDCDDIVDEDIPVDTGEPPDTGEPVDTGGSGDTDETGDSGTGETGDTETGDTDVPADIDLDGDGFLASVDCDEHNLHTFPGAAERMDGADNDCDGTIDEGTAAGDDDLDGFSELGGDCDDTRSDRYPGAPDDTEDGLDHDCDGTPDDGIGQDADGDGTYDTSGDCDDANASIYPGAADPTDGVDNDCDGSTDEDGLSVDADGDGYSPLEGDCDDADPTIHFGATDTPDDFIDQDCSGTDNYDADRDGDPSVTSGGTDCDDTRSNVYPGAAELCGDLTDNDCDGTAEEGCDVEDTGVATATDAGCGCDSGAPGGAGLAGAFALAAMLVRRRTSNRYEMS